MNTLYRIFFLFWAVTNTYFTPFLYSKDEVKFARISHDECGNFYNGIATVKSGIEESQIINRKGEVLGQAPGTLKYADEKIRVYDLFPQCILTDNHNKTISKKYDDIELAGNGLFIARKDAKYFILNSFGKEVLKSNKYISQLCNEFPYSFFNTDAGNVLFEGDKYVATFNDVDLKTLRSDFPIIKGHIKQSGKNQNQIFIKETKSLLHPIGEVMTMAGIDFYIVNDGIDKTYFDCEGKIIDKNVLSTSSSGVKIERKDNGKYILVDKNGAMVYDFEFDDVDPFFWQSDLIAVKKDDKWGYLDHDGSVNVPFKYDSAGPFIMGLAGVNNESKPILLNIETYKSYNLGGSPIKDIHDYMVIIEEGIKLFIWSNTDMQNDYGFFNSKTCNSLHGLVKLPHFKGGAAGTYYYDDNYNMKQILVSIDGEVVARAKSHAFFEYIGEGIYAINEEKDGNYITYLYDKTGKELYNSASTKVHLIPGGKVYNGVIPVFIEGNLQNGSSHGYIYNTFTSSIDDIMISYGTMGQNIAEANDYIADRVNYLDYFIILGNKALRDKRYSEAVEYFSRALELHSLCKEAMYGKGISLMHQGKFKEALYEMVVADEVPGVFFAKALCCFNLGNMNKTRYYCDKVERYDPSYDSALELRKEAINIIESQKREQRDAKLNNAIAILNAISSGLNLVSQSMSSAVNGNALYYNSRNKTVLQNNVRAVQSGKQKQCTSCHGTGLSSAKERAAFYNYIEETHSNTRCEICGDRDSHYHKPCPSCGGKGYVISAF